MGFLGVYTAVYDYEPQADGELAIGEGDVLYVLDKGEDDGWWKAKKKAGAEDEEEPVGLIPNNYVEEARIVSYARAIYEYTRQTDEELSFPEEAILEVYDTSDPDWIFVGLDGEFGFVPSNYIDMQAATTARDSSAPSAPPALPVRPQSVVTPTKSPSGTATSSSTPAGAVAAILQGRAQPSVVASSPSPPPQSPQSPQSTRKRAQTTEPESGQYGEGEYESRSPALPSRPHGSVDEKADSSSIPARAQAEEAYKTPGGFHMYNINEMVSVMGKRKKMPTTLGINLGTGTILIAPERADDEPPQEWTADRMIHYSREGKHVFMELVRPSKSIDFHAGAKDTAEEIVAALGELAGAVRAEGLREVILAGSRQTQRKGHILYDFMAQGDDEVTVAAGDEVFIMDDSKSEEWWQVRRLKNGKEGVVPSSYIEISATSTQASISSTLDSAKSTVEKNRVDEIRLTKEAIKAGKAPQQVGHGTPLPERGSSLLVREYGSNSSKQRGKRENGRGDVGNNQKPKSKPDSSKVRTWTDRSGSFSVEAQFLGLKDSKIHLHKMNGVKIAVPIAKMSREDLEYVENMTGISLEDDKPLADVKRAKSMEKRPPDVGASVSKAVKPEYDWFQFFLSCDVPVGLCERYAQAFTKDSMDESVLPDVNATILRTLGLREGDIIKVMRTLDAKFGRERGNQDSDSQPGGLFSGPGGALRNNTRKGRPAPAVQTSDVVDAATFARTGTTNSATGNTKAASPPNGGSSASTTTQNGGFDDDAWDVKPISKAPGKEDSTAKNAAAAATTTQTTSVSQPSLSSGVTDTMKELSLLTEPLQPSKKELSATAKPDRRAEHGADVPLQHPPGASPSFFSTLSSNAGQQHTQPDLAPPGSTSSPKVLARQRPAPPSISPTHGSLVPPPPQRPLSAPQSVHASVFTPPYLTAQVTGSTQGQVAPPGQSLNDIAQARLQQQYTAQLQHLQPAATGFLGLQPQHVAPFSIGVPSQQQFIHSANTGAQGHSPFADPNRPSLFAPLQVQQTGLQGSAQQPISAISQGLPSAAHLNSFLPPAIEPERTGLSSLHSHQAGLNSASHPQLLLPQKTGPPPPVRFGISSEPTKLMPQQTGRRANLSQATPDNPFGF
ncbi:uncharacterized protein UV8b_00138 [Ustilaginoidea virens]|uniref:Actin cytoskeleton-regulatory complex protein SLA1 n=1 Tax=Ustilaginoidea virens TaxID=1159556 RepID=A0A8E5HIJ3_USTVR|nr:uncharacterized protein UV8b_00138 [Ustilaginoidea virens]QUC15897.1 hypothetical protein UV8b_00138 [Ustilaginoidea virens]